MGQIPVSAETHKKVNQLKLKSSYERSEKNKTTATWDNLISAFYDLSQNHKEEFMKIILNKENYVGDRGRNGKVENKPIEKIKEDLKAGKKVTSKELEKANEEKNRFKE